VVTLAKMNLELFERCGPVLSFAGPGRAELRRAGLARGGLGWTGRAGLAPRGGRVRACGRGGDLPRALAARCCRGRAGPAEPGSGGLRTASRHPPGRRQAPQTHALLNTRSEAPGGTASAGGRRSSPATPPRRRRSRGTTPSATTQTFPPRWVSVT
jgi:hypothetical protein